LSRGEQQRVAFARALYFDPPVILADEPTASLDQANAEIVIAHLAKLASQGKTVITASHDAALIANAKRLVKLDRGLVKAGAAK
jgi:putative ABC transport system ATP-binding protein